MISRRAIAATVGAGALALTALGAAGIAASADSVQSDGTYACSFTGSNFNCSPTVQPTATESVTTTETATATVTATATTTATVTASPSPTPSPTPTAAKALTGTSTPGLSVFPDAKAVRYFWTGLPSSTLPFAPVGAALVVSFKTVPTSSAFTADLDAWAASGRQVYWTWHHEPDNGDMTGAAYVTQMNALLDMTAGHLHPNVHSLTILTAAALSNGTAESYYVPRVDVVGFDCYQLTNEPKALTYAAGKGKPLIFPEVGNKTTGLSNSDAEALAYAKTFWPALTSNVAAAIWWSGSTDTLTDKPNTTAYLRSQN